MTEVEIWLEYGWVMDDGFHDMLWYNEGNAAEITHFIEALDKKLKEGEPAGAMYFKVRVGKDEIQEIRLG